MTTTALIGTTKGLCVLTGERGGTFAERGPLFPGENVDATLIDARRDARHPTWFVGSMSFHWGPTLRRSDDAGESWKVCNTGLCRVPSGTHIPEVGYCAHKVVLDPQDSNVLYMQDHGGVNKSVDRTSIIVP